MAWTRPLGLQGVGSETPGGARVCRVVLDGLMSRSFSQALTGEGSERWGLALELRKLRSGASWRGGTSMSD